MSISDSTSHRGLSGDLYCPRCNTPLLPQATFCSSCGERLDKKKDPSSLLQDAQDITVRYHITSLVRRRPSVNLYFALDNQQSAKGQQRMVAIRDIDITPLQDNAREQATVLVQQEYDLLRRWHIPYVMPVVDLRYFQGHLYMVAAFPNAHSAPSTTGKLESTQESADKMQSLYTLQDFLQSGQGVPLEQQTLLWAWHLCQALYGLHRHQIVIGELDPYTIILNENSDRAEPALMISWLPPQLRKLLSISQASTTPRSYFSAPEALKGRAEPRSDIYSLGAILYLLLTGSPPSKSALRRGRLRTPHELNPRISPNVNDCVMQALSIEPQRRFESVGAMAEALRDPLFRRQQTSKLDRRGIENTDTPTPDSSAYEGDGETVRIVPLSQARWQKSRSQADIAGQIPHRPIPPRPTSRPQNVDAIQAEQQQQPSDSLQSTPQPPATPNDTQMEVPLSVPVEQADEKEAKDSQQSPSESETASLPPENSLNAPPLTLKQRITGVVPAITFEWLKKNRGEKVSASSPVDNEETIDTASLKEAAIAWFQQLQRIILGQQQRAIMATAIIESPMRVQPDRVFTLRLHIMGRDESAFAPGAEKGDRHAGLSSLVHGDTISIEVRSVLHQSYAYIVQQATVTIPAAGYVAEVMIPMQPLSNAPTGRRDRLHIFILDGQRRPLYEKPFVVEVFVSHLVKRGQEGHHVLTIPV
jgi:serine/threonine protein kinase